VEFLNEATDSHYQPRADKVNIIHRDNMRLAQEKNVNILMVSNREHNDIARVERLNQIDPDK
jgi:hypothetical protein